MVVLRLQGGTPWSLAKIPYDERVCFGKPVERLYFTLLDGNRTVFEAIRMTDAMLRRVTPDEDIGKAVEQLRYLARYGYFKILRDGERKAGS